MYALIGVSHADHPGGNDDKYVVAYFTTRPKAIKYMKEATISSRGWVKEYKKGTVLEGCDGAYVERSDNENVPIDPEVK